MKLIQGEERVKLEEMLKQLLAHGNGGGSPALTAAMNAFGAMSTHDLAIRLAERLLSVERPHSNTGSGCGGIDYGCADYGGR